MSTHRKTMKTFPKQLFVSREQDGDESYLIAHEDGVADSIVENGTPTATYQLVEVGKVVVERRFESKKK
jgi:hypothetical protein